MAIRCRGTMSHIKTASKTFHDSLARLLEAKLEPYKKKDLSRETCIEIYTTMFETITDLLQKTKAPLGNESANYIAQQYYDGLVINDKQEQLDPNIFTERAKIENIPIKEIAFLSMLLMGTDFRFPLIEEIKRRS
jgi:hypothetical protein